MRLDVEKIGDIAVIAPDCSDLNAENMALFKQAMAPVLATHTRIVLDLEQVRFIDSVGLATILSILKHLNTRSGDLKICGLSRSVRTLFEMVRMHRLFEIFPYREEAVRASLWSCPWKLLSIVTQPEDSIRRHSGQRPINPQQDNVGHW
jgi:anti-sigma B factor antagonist